MRREQRLRRRRDFDAVYRTGRPVHGDFLSLRVHRTDLEHSRVGFAVNKRAGGAVTRNRIKRRLRAAIASLALPGGWDVVVSARAPAATVPYDELVRVLTSTLRRARILGNREQGTGNRTAAHGPGSVPGDTG
jgi:ribonuclease P protein component